MQTEVHGRTVVLASEVRVVREALQLAINRSSGYMVLGCTGSAQELLRLAIDLKPDIVLTESSVARTPGLIRAITRTSPATRTVAFAVSNCEAEIMACAEAGVCGYVLRDGGLEEIVQALDGVLRGEIICPPTVVACAFARIATLAANRSRGTHRLQLPDRQAQILSLIEAGLSNKEIAHCLSIELSTVKNHIHVLLSKMGVRRRSEAVAKYRLAHGTSANGSRVHFGPGCREADVQPAASCFPTLSKPNDDFSTQGKA